jgi:hypothetical protein
MKKLFFLLMVITLVFSGVIAADNNLAILKVGAAVVPHAEILEAAKPELKKQGIDLQIVVLDDEGQLNPALADTNRLMPTIFSMFLILIPSPRKKDTNLRWPAKFMWNPSAFTPRRSSPRLA